MEKRQHTMATLGTSPMPGNLVQLLDEPTPTPHPLFPEHVLLGFLIISSVVPTSLLSPTSWVPHEQHRGQPTPMPQHSPPGLWVLNKCLGQRFMAQ